MGKASSNKKVARAAKAGGGARARSAGDRNLLFPVVLTMVVILGTLLVVYARNERIGVEQTRPISGVDHWHSAYGVYVCNEYIPAITGFTAQGGTHAHNISDEIPVGDGIVHIHPFSESRSGTDATLTNFFEDAPGFLLEDDRLEIPGRDPIDNDTQCDGEDVDSELQILFWPRAADAVAGGEPIRITSDFDRLRFTNDKQVFVVYFGNPNFTPDPPDSLSRLDSIGGDIGDENVPAGLDFDGDGIDDAEQVVVPSTIAPDDDTTDESSGADGTDESDADAEAPPADEVDPADSDEESTEE